MSLNQGMRLEIISCAGKKGDSQHYSIMKKNVHSDTGILLLYQGFPLHMNLAVTSAKGSDNFNDATVKMARE